MKKSLIILSAIIILGGAFISSAYAGTKDIELEITSSLSLEVPGQTSLNIIASIDGTFGSTYFDVLASTNNKDGYTLSMTTANTYLESTGNARIEAIPFVDGGITEEAFSATTDTNLLNHWGVSIDNTTSYNPVKTSGVVKKTEVEATADATRFNIATKANSALAPGTYTTNLVFQLVANVVEPDEGTEFLNDDPDPTEDSDHIDGRKNDVVYGGGTLARAFEVYYTNTLHKSMYVPVRDTGTGEYTGEYKEATVGRDYSGIAASEYRFAIQDMSSEICANTTVIPSELQVLDLRDNKTYWISKLADGKCWMTQNLDLELHRDSVFTSNDTDLNYYGGNGYTDNYGYSYNNGVISWSPFWDVVQVESTDTSGLIYSDYDSNDYLTPMSIDPMDVYQVDEYFALDDYYGCNYMAIPRTCKRYFVRESSNTHRHIGDYYSWPAAVANNNTYSYQNDTLSDPSGNPPNSICPKGWRLPTASSDEEGTEENSANEYARLRYVYGATDQAVMGAPLYMVRAGYIHSNNNQGFLYGPGTYALYWTGSVAYNYYFSPDYTALSTYSRSSLMSVRCIAR